MSNEYFFFRGGYVEDPAGDRWWSADLLKKVEAERDKARAEVERRDREHEALVETAQKALAYVTAERDEARAEVERLRDAGTVLVRSLEVAEQTPRYGDPRSVWGIVNGLTEVSQKESYGSDRVAADRVAGKVLEKFAF